MDFSTGTLRNSRILYTGAKSKSRSLFVHTRASRRHRDVRFVRTLIICYVVVVTRNNNTSLFTYIAMLMKILCTLVDTA